MAKRVATWMEPFLKHKKALIIDGGMGTTLAEQGANVASAYWSASMFLDKDSPVKPDLVYNVHMQFLRAGSDVLLANTYKLSKELLDRLPDRAERPDAESVIKKCIALACAARDDYQKTLPASEPRRLVAAAFGPYGTSLPFSGAEYKGNYECSYEELCAFWERRLRTAMASDCDLYGFETIPDLRETQAIVDVLNDVKPNRPCYVSWTCKDAIHIHGGPKLLDCVQIVEDCNFVDTIGVNCVAPQYILPIIQDLQKHSSKAILTYPNSGREWDARKDVRAWTGVKQDFASMTNRWFDAGCVAIGGCCDCNATHIESIFSSLNTRAKL